METYRKLEETELLAEDFGRQPYLKKLNLEGARTKFNYRTKMTQFVKLNYTSDPKYSEDHVLWYPSYASLREEKDLDSDEDLCAYLQEVFRIKHILEIMK
jgi:hypothetical protein